MSGARLPFHAAVDSNPTLWMLECHRNVAPTSTTHVLRISSNDIDSKGSIGVDAGNKMNQTTSALLRMTDDERPFSKDLKDLFSTLIVSLMPFTPHRVRFTKVKYTFLSENAIQNLGSLKFSQSNSMPDPENPSRIVTTTSTTTFSMSKEMGQSLCQLFLDAHFIESADGRHEHVFAVKGSLWQLTPKGITVLDRFCSRNGLHLKQLSDLINQFSTQLITLERDRLTDKILLDPSTVEVIFSRFAGFGKKSVEACMGTFEPVSLYDRGAAIGVKTSPEFRINGKLYYDTFTGKAAVNWLMDYCTTMDVREAIEISSLFIQHNLIESVRPDSSSSLQDQDHKLFQPTKNAVYTLSQRGKELSNPANLSRSASITKKEAASQYSKDTNAHRLDKILTDPTLRLLFREHLRGTHCEENLAFYEEVDVFIRNCKVAARDLHKEPTKDAAVDKVKAQLALSYGIYNVFLAPGSPRELNIHHQLHRNLASRMSKTIAQDNAIEDTLQEVTSLFEDAQIAVFKLMTTDSVPKFFHSSNHTF